jgi:glucokinase
MGVVLLEAGSACILARQTVPTGFSASAQELLRRLQEAATQLAAEAEAAGHPVHAVGVGMPGLQDPDGCVRDCSNLPALNGVAVAKEISDALSLPSCIDNDLNVAALGEYRFGGHGHSDRLLVVALGTGIGAAMIAGGAVLRPTSNGLGDPGHILVVDPSEARPCRCGARGCLETAVSGWAVAEQAGVSDPAEVFRSPEAAHRRLVSRLATWLAMGLASFCVLYEPGLIVLGGKLAAAAGDGFRTAVEQQMRAIVQGRFRDVPLRPSQLEDRAGVLGAAAMALFP